MMAICRHCKHGVDTTHYSCPGCWCDEGEARERDRIVAILRRRAKETCGSDAQALLDAVDEIEERGVRDERE